MNWEDLQRELEQLTPEQYGYLGITALFGPLALRMLGFKMLATLIRPLALLAILGGLYAKQQHSDEQGA